MERSLKHNWWSQWMLHASLVSIIVFQKNVRILICKWWETFTRAQVTPLTAKVTGLLPYSACEPAAFSMLGRCTWRRRYLVAAQTSQDNLHSVPRVRGSPPRYAGRGSHLLGSGERRGVSCVREDFTWNVIHPLSNSLLSWSPCLLVNSKLLRTTGLDINFVFTAKLFRLPKAHWHLIE